MTDQKAIEPTCGHCLYPKSAHKELWGTAGTMVLFCPIFTFMAATPPVEQSPPEAPRDERGPEGPQSGQTGLREGERSATEARARALSDLGWPWSGRP